MKRENELSRLKEILHHELKKYSKFSYDQLVDMSMPIGLEIDIFDDPGNFCQLTIDLIEKSKDDNGEYMIISISVKSNASRVKGGVMPKLGFLTAYKDGYRDISYADESD